MNADSQREANRFRDGVVLARYGCANGIGGVMSFALGELSIPRQAHHRVAPVYGGDLVLFAIVVAILGPGGYLVGRRLFEPVRRWMAEGRVPTASEREATFAFPFRIAAASLALWLLPVVVFGLWNLHVRHDSALAIAIAAAILLGGATTSAVAFLLVERAMRPLFAAVLANGVPERRTSLGIKPRLLVAWMVGSALPLLVMAISISKTELRPIPLPALVWLFTVVILLVGAITLFVSGRALADPLSDVRRALGRVQKGDLDVELPVDDAGEVGLLQAGFNEMVAGLRERRLIEDLFGRHVGGEVARQALEHGAGLGGEQRDASALFVDVIGSTALAQQRPADEVVEMLNAVFAAVVAAVEPEGGWVNKFEGDGALCIFGAPADQPDHAARALRAARSLRRQVTELARTHPGLDAGIGVSSGTVVAGNVGTERRYEYTVIGDPVNEAARLTDEAKRRPARVLASAAAVERAGDEASCWTAADTLVLRGRSEPTPAYEPVPAVAPVT